MCRGPELRRHVDGVSRAQFELDRVDLKGHRHGDGIEEGVLHILPAYIHAISGLRPVLGLLGTPEVLAYGSAGKVTLEAML
jgi:hypothetical protein